MFLTPSFPKAQKHDMLQDKIIIGLILGFLIPVVGYAILLEIYDLMSNGGIISDQGFSQTFRERTIALLAICFNLIPFTFFNKKRMQNGMRGLVFPTVLFVIVWLFYFKDSIL